MIQRKQSLYLLCAVIVLVLTMFLPLGKFLVADKEIILTSVTHSEIGVGISLGSIPLAILAVVATLVPLVNIFLYKRRMFQIRLCIAEFIILIGLQGFVVWVLYLTKSALAVHGTVSMVYAVAAIFPLVALLFVWLAMRGIMKDEALIRSMNRIR